MMGHAGSMGLLGMTMLALFDALGCLRHGHDPVLCGETKLCRRCYKVYA